MAGSNKDSTTDDIYKYSLTAASVIYTNYLMMHPFVTYNYENMGSLSSNNMEFRWIFMAIVKM